MKKKQYFCIVFFMVLDLRLIKVGLSGDNPLFFRVRQIVLTDAAMRHKAHYCLRSPHHNPNRLRWGPINNAGAMRRRYLIFFVL